MFYDFTPQSRFLLGTAGYPSPAILQQAIAASGTEIITVSLRREGAAGAAIREMLTGLDIACYRIPQAATR